ncbi:chitin deacetylase precursor [Colletotrichum plurivorum]|uniref:Chitin deacetylase n=1 Tax=Colletotrichum plurivorum TaxID=2175906 RepID=A0A8H6K5M9_9PEZI|nr:chitin deacetylase precursor [Colletotrichum plurivorum]
MEPPFISKHGQVVRKCKIPGTVAFTFDYGPSFYTDYVLNQLAQHNAHATFFLNTTPELSDQRHLGYWETLVRRMAADGHLVGLTTGPSEPGSENKAAEDQQLLEARKRISGILVSHTSSSGPLPMYVRAPKSCTVENGCIERLTVGGQRLVFPGVDLRDTTPGGLNATSPTLLDSLAAADLDKNSFLIQMHDTEKETALGLATLLRSFTDRGFSPVTVGECIGDLDHFMYLQAPQAVEAAEDNGIQIQVSWGESSAHLRLVGFLAIGLLELAAVAALWWATRRYRRIRARNHIAR